MSDVEQKDLASDPKATPKVESEPKATPAAAVTEPAKEEPKPQAEPPKEAPKAGEAKPDDKTTTDGDKASGEPKDKPEKVVPEKYELALSENSPLDAEHLREFERLAKESGLSQDEAVAALKRQEAEVSNVYERLGQQWKEQSEKDPEIGGEKFAENVHFAHQALERFGTPALKEALNRTGYGNHPELLRFVAKVGRAMGDDTFVRPGAGIPQKEKSIAEHLYPSMFEGKES